MSDPTDDFKVRHFGDQKMGRAPVPEPKEKSAAEKSAGVEDWDEGYRTGFAAGGMQVAFLLHWERDCSARTAGETPPTIDLGVLIENPDCPSCGERLGTSIPAINLRREPE